ncbi:hypothetical protein GDO78_018678 [Eleutherodactylus coqui]|uniref:Homeobox domain-containing protein n=1 Tax=Eleutherodactylus coqui TaxID=57060 RepID=A0A8J6JUN2_ELECQ|nr:hypothetical protein GDO78_018678 [Eleutherodactylus coqui]
MVRQSFSIDYILTGSKEETMSDIQPSRPHVPCIPQPLAPCKFSKRPTGQFKSNDESECAEDTKTFQNLPDQPENCLQYDPASTATPERDWESADESTSSCSEDESEQACSRSPECRLQDDDDDDPRSTSPKSEMQRRMRTAFTPQQICKLEEMFKKQRYLGASERNKLASTLQMSEIQVKTWFQNRRMKLKRQMQDHQHRLSASSVYYTHTLQYYHGPPIPVPNLPFYQTPIHSYQTPETSYTPDPRFFSMHVPPPTIMNNAYPEPYSPFFNSHYM